MEYEKSEQELEDNVQEQGDLQDFDLNGSPQHSDNEDYVHEEEEESSSFDEAESGKRRKRGRKKGTKNKAKKTRGASGKKETKETDGRKNPILPLLYCYICNRSYTKVYPLNKHLDEHYSNRKVINDNPFPCSQCGKIFTAEKFLQCHMRTHQKNMIHDCRVCNRRFSSSRILKIHQKYHSKERKYSCEICCESFRFENALVIHMEEHIKAMPFPENLLRLHVIPSIDERSQAPPGVNQELLNGGILYKCSQCPQKFATINERRNHQSKDHPKIHTCEYCGKEVKSSFAYRLHLVSHTKEKTFKCKLCGDAFAYPNLLVVHRRVAHGTGDPDKLLRPFRCEPCGKAYIFKYALTEHINYVHKNLKLICDLCGYSYGTKARLRRHFKRVHLRTKMNEKQRATCARMVSSRAEYGKERKCPECDFVANKLADIRNHRIEEHFNGLFCTECNETLTSILTYRYHMDDHRDGITIAPGPGRNGRIFGCSNCDKFYTDRRFLREHINARHRSMIFKCDHCERTFQTKRYLIRHLSLHHGIINKTAKPRKVDGLKKKAPKKMKIKVPDITAVPAEASHTSHQLEPPQSSPLALHIPHQSPQTILTSGQGPVGLGIQHYRMEQVAKPITNHGGIQIPFKTETPIQFIHFGNIDSLH
ncbi:zinc finger protein 154-like [Lutzomyia longipalpis]|uniref:zinc finger protein 154-like n=1 Tax=Lutzomyia longipalpis TaxID=7200 RepID=UPI002483F0C8|nr:zinc finger protein 154-like [Lutzomyia longipalpis]